MFAKGNSMRILVTGATGFVGSTLSRVLAQSGHVVRAALRQNRELPEHFAEKVVIGDIHAGTDWRAALANVDCVVHAAARAHVLNDPASNSKLYFETNVRGTAQLAREAASSSVRRLVYISSVKVNGEHTEGPAYKASDEPKPQDPYGVSKWLAEQTLMEHAAATGLEAAVVRPPLIYGPGVRANFLRLMRWVERGLPLPFGQVRNQRSLVSVWNLCNLIERVLEHPAAAGNIWMVSDGEDLSTPELIRGIAAAMERRITLLPVPVGWLAMAGEAVGKGAEIARLCGSLTVDIEATRQRLGWSPPLNVQEGLSRTVAWYLGERQRER
jgi:UDP-glucose 4-epimerase